jgi:simple sugar transport system permease protein
VLALIIPVLAGLGLNFAVVLGAMAGQVGIIAATHLGVKGLAGILLCAGLALPLAVALGWMTGKLLNRARGKEMITTLILGFFANGVYQLVFLILIGTLIPMQNEVLVLSSGVGLRSTIDLTGGLKFGLDDVFKLRLPFFCVVFGGAAGALLFARRLIGRRPGGTAVIAAALAAVLWGGYEMAAGSLLNNIQVPVATFLVIAGLCVFTFFIMKTKLGQDMRTVGQDIHVAEVSGINSNRVRIIAMIISTVLAAWGQILFLQNLGAFSTYGSHEQTGMFAIAALLIGGASVTRATIGQALLGIVLFHTLFIISPIAGRVLFGDAQLGEFFRSFVAYGVIGLSLGLHSWRKMLMARQAGQL